MIARLRSWLETRAATTPSDYTNLRIAEAYQQVTGEAGVRGSAAYIGALNFIEDSLAIAQVEGEFSDSLRPHLGAIGRALTDCGESVFEIRLSADGKLALLPASIAAVSGGADPSDWSYLLTRSGPSESTSIRRDAGAVLAFVAHSLPKTPWRGRGRLEASATGQLLADLEKQMASEARFTPARLVSGTMVREQRKEIKDTIANGGIVTISGGKSGGSESTKALEVGALNGEFNQGGVTLHEGISRIVSGALGVPPDLLGSTASEAGTRESFRRFAASTISALIEIIQVEWTAKIGTLLEISLDNLRAGDISARSRSIGTRAAAVGRLVTAGVDLERAMRVAGLDG